MRHCCQPFLGPLLESNRFAGFYSAKYPNVFLTGNRNNEYFMVVLALTIEIMVFLVSSYFERMEKSDLVR